MGKTIAFCNQKGGVGKTTCCIQFGAALRESGKRVLFIDMDPQCNLTYILKGDNEKATILEAMLGQAQIGDVVQRGDGFDLIPGSVSLSVIEQALTQPGKEYRLREKLEPIKNLYDFVVIDSPPTLGLSTINILTASDDVIIPAMADVMSVQGIGQLYNTVDAVRTYCNKDLCLKGIVLTRYSDRLRHNRMLMDMIKETADAMNTKVFETTIRDSVIVRESETACQDIFRFAPTSHLAGDFWNLTMEYLQEQQ